ncbi:unnamed protein product, partial [Polarella glacialis]
SCLLATVTMFALSPGGRERDLLLSASLDRKQQLGSARFLSKRRGQEEGFFPQSPVFVVEEHHEALPYWRQQRDESAAHVLLHFDAHPDSAVPDKGYGPELGMSSNDVFILAAGLEGLVDRYVWVWPSWDKRGPRHGSPGPAIFVVLLGRTESGSPCACCPLEHTAVDEQMAANPLAWKSHGDDTELASSCDGEVAENRQLQVCVPTHKLLHVTVREEDVGLLGAWWPSLLGGNLILDVDEDFLGQQIVRNRLTFSDAAVAQAFSCQGNASESELDSALRAVLSQVQEDALSKSIP